MGILCAIGGGEIWGIFNGKKRPIETEAIDRELLSLTKKSTPKVLFIPTASWDSKGYISNFTSYYTSLGCEVEVLLLHNKFIDLSVIKKKVFSSDMIYVWGGNTLKMLKLWKKVWLIPLLEQALKKNIILSGLSAGGICWLHGGMSDSRQFTNKNAGFIIVKGLDFAPVYFCPHFDRDIKRKDHLNDFIKKTYKKWIVLEEWTAFLVKNKERKILQSKPHATAYLVYKKNKEIIYEKLPSNNIKNIDTLHY